MGTLALVKQYDTGLPLIVDLSYRDTALDLTDDITVFTPVVFIMTLAGATTPTINRLPAFVTAVDLAAKIVTVTYYWGPDNTAVVGRYRGEFEFNLSGGPVTAPTGGYLQIRIEDDLG